MANLNEITVNAERIHPLKTWGKYSYFKDSNGKGHWNDTSKNERLPNGNRITDKNGNIFQFNSDGSVTKMYDATTGKSRLSDAENKFILLYPNKLSSLVRKNLYNSELVERLVKNYHAPSNWLLNAKANTAKFEHDLSDKKPEAIKRLLNAENFSKGVSKLDKVMAGTLAAGVAPVALDAAATAGAAQILPWAGRTILNSAKYVVQHPIESFVIQPTINEATNKAVDKIPWLSQPVKRGISTGLGFILSPHIANEARRYIGVPIQNKIVSAIENNTKNKFLSTIPHLTEPSLTNISMGYNPANSSIASTVKEAVQNPTEIGSALSSLIGRAATDIHYQLPAAVTAGVLSSTNLDKAKNTGIKPVDMATDALIYGGLNHASQRIARNPISNAKLASNGNLTPQEGLKSVITNFKNQSLSGKALFLFTDNPKLSQFYTMFYKPSAQQLQLVDDHGVNLGQGGAGAFASKENDNGVAIFNQKNPKAGETLSDGRTVESVNYVGKPTTKQSGLDEVLHNISDRNNPVDYNRQAKGNKQYIISSYLDKHPTLNSLKLNGYTEALLQNGKYIDITNITDPRDFAKLDLYLTSGRGDFVEKNGTYNSAGNRINGIFRNPKNDKYMVKILDISGIGSVTGGHNSTMQQIADSDVPSMIVTKEAEITNYKDLLTFLNRYVQSVPNKTMVKSLNVYNDIVKPYMFNKPNFNKLSEMKEDIDNLPEFVRRKNKDTKTYEMVKNPLIDKFNTLTNLAETGISKTLAPNTQNKINSLALKLYVINTPKYVTSSFAENKNNKKNELRQYFTFSSPALEENSLVPSNLEGYLKAKKYSSQAKETLLNLPTDLFNLYVNNHIIDLSKFRKGGKIQ